jgi:LysM repeat protein
MPAAFANPSLGNENQAAPPPPAQFAADDADDSHTHVVADGDSLEKIAALYLSDPQRGKEIYELNRDVLSDPNLLPIGAELKIPDRASRTSWNRQSCRPGFQGDATIRQASNGDLVPVRSLPEVNVIPPHAQLTRPIAAD